MRNLNPETRKKIQIAVEEAFQHQIKELDAFLLQDLSKHRQRIIGDTSSAPFHVMASKVIDDALSNGWLGRLLVSLNEREKENLFVSEALSSYHAHYPKRDKGSEFKPNLPLSYFHRARIVEQMESKLQSQTPSTCIIFGPRGFGKSTVAADYFESYQGGKFWLDANQQTTADQFGKHLLVVDRLDEAGIGWLEDNRAVVQSRDLKSIYITSNHEIRDSLVKIRACAKCVVEVDGFSDEEVGEFLERTLTDELHAFDSANIVTLNRKLKGCPLLWQLVLESVGCGSAPDSYLFLDGDDDGLEELAKSILNRWLNETGCLDSPTKASLDVVCSVSLIGIDLDALSHVLGKTKESVRHSLSPFLQNGLIQIKRGIVQPHSLLRSAACHIGAETDEQRDGFVDQYFDYLDLLLQEQEIDPSQTFTLLDAWLVALKEAFNYPEGEPEAFSQKYGRAIKRLKPVMNAAQIKNVHKSWLSRHLKNEMDSLHCSALISLAIVVRSLEPDPLLGDVMWLGSERNAHHSDGWALADSISAAAHHWNGTAADRERGITLLKQQFEIWLDCVKRGAKYHLKGSTEESDGEFDPESALAAPAFFGGMCLLGGPKAILEYARNVELVRLIPQIIPPIVLCFFELGFPRAAKELMRTYWDSTPPSLIKLITLNYLHKNVDETIPDLIEGEVIEKLHPLSLYLTARWSHSKSFDAYVDELLERNELVDEKKFLYTLRF